jgi:hypothetical protein
MGEVTWQRRSQDPLPSNIVWKFIQGCVGLVGLNRELGLETNLGHVCVYTQGFSGKGVGFTKTQKVRTAT